MPHARNKLSMIAKVVNSQLKKYTDSSLRVVKVIMAIVLDKMPMVSRIMEPYPMNTRNQIHDDYTFMILARHSKQCQNISDLKFI